MTRVMPVFLPTLGTDRFRLMMGDAAPPPETPLILVGRDGRRRVVTATDAAALEPMPGRPGAHSRNRLVARRRAILDRRCARRRVARVGRDGRMAAIEQKNGAPGTRGSKTYLDGLPATASATLEREQEAEAGSRRDVAPPIVAVFPA